MKLFRKDIDPRCAYCQRGQQINEREVACVKRGVVPMEHHCRTFKYDPLKRVPPEDRCSAFKYDPLKRVPPRPAALNTGKLNESDFSLS